MSALARPSAVILDCADPALLADFYAKATGWSITYSDDDFATVAGPDGSVQLAFQRIDGYEPASWPDDRKHAHVDFAVADVERAADELLALGATRPEFQPGEGKWTVLADPSGHVFCIAAAD